MAGADADGKKIAQLCEMGCTRAAAKSALKACKWDVSEAAMAVFEDKHQNAQDLPTDDEDDGGPARVHATALGTDLKGKGRQMTKAPTPAEDTDDEVQQLDDDAEDDDHNEGEDMDYDDEYPIEAEDEQENHGATFEGSEAGSVDYGDGDAYGFMSTDKNRKETITEVEEPIKKIFISPRERGDFSQQSSENTLLEAELFGLQRWLSGCPEGNEQQQLFPLYNTLSGDSFAPAPCPHNCGATIKHFESDFYAVPTDFKTYLDRLEAIVQANCSKCQGKICLACNEACGAPSSQSISANASIDAGKGKSTANDGYSVAPDILLHCSDLQAVILGVGLFMAERLWEDAKSGGSSDSSLKAVNTKKRKVTPADDPDDSDSLMSPAVNNITGRHKSGVGYGGSNTRGGRDDGSGIIAAQKAQQEKDKALASLLALVRVYLPNRDRPGPFKNSDHMPAGQTLAHLRRRFNPIASLLLSAESLSDMSDRKDLYTEFMAWLETMSAHDNLAGLMGQPIMRASSITYSTAASNGATSTTATPRREKVIVFEANPGPRELLERILSQVRVAQRVAEAAKAREAEQQGNGPQPTVHTDAAGAAGSGLAESKRLMEFCDTIVKAVSKIDRALQQSKRGEAVLRSISATTPVTARAGENAESRGSKLEDISSLSEEEIKRRYIEWAEQVKYGHYNWEAASTGPSDGGPTYKHNYSAEARAISSFPSRNTALMKEHMALSASLPSDWESSVFLKTDENRPDIIKALIIGPDRSPYQNGCYLFDILLGGSYNQAPPTVKSMTTKGGKYRLNPNLYAEGKVCLSLLGTWSGPGWVAGKSTLLQVLISIQAMILCEEPIANEPSFERELGTPRSKAYNANVRRMNVHIAMLEYLKNPPEGFEEIIATHFRYKARTISRQLDTWVAEDDGKALCRDSMSAINRFSSAQPANADVGSSGSAFARDVDLVKGYLARLEKGDDIFAK